MDDLNGFLVNAALVAALVPVLTAIGQLLKSLPGLRAVPEWLPLILAGVGIVLAVGYTLARAQSSGTSATSVELVLAAISGVMAGTMAARTYDAVYTSLAREKGPVRAARLMKTTPKRA